MPSLTSVSALDTVVFGALPGANILLSLLHVHVRSSQASRYPASPELSRRTASVDFSGFEDGARQRGTDGCDR